MFLRLFKGPGGGLDPWVPPDFWDGYYFLGRPSGPEPPRPRTQHRVPTGDPPQLRRLPCPSTNPFYESRYCTLQMRQADFDTGGASLPCSRQELRPWYRRVLRPTPLRYCWALRLSIDAPERCLCLNRSIDG